jgi:2-keto-4-pentenoate hydratase/2-oxohepta-3-ene-1,7-dioic acid hydratase in catechol pathway
VRLGAPVPKPGKIVAVARNYAAHAAERGAETPEEPVLFVKASSAVIGPGEDILLPAASERVDYEGELAVVIGRIAREVPVESALDYVAGYTVANDVTARDFQNTRGQRFLGKSCDTFAPMGPVLVTRDEIDDPQKLRLETRLDGEVVQSASTGEMVFTVAEVIAFATRLMTLHPGDVLLTGTPSGVGAAAEPPRFLRDGDVVDVEIEGIGRLRNHVAHAAGRM